MEIIPLVAIEIIDDFINHLSPEQLDEFGSRFIGRHEVLDTFIQVSTDDMKNDEAKGLIYKLYVIVLKCFDYYAIEIPPITQEFAQMEMIKWSMHINNMNPNFPDKAKIAVLKKQVAQKHLTDYIVNQILETPTNTDYFKKSELLPACLTFFVLINILHQYMETLLPPEK